MKKVFIPFCFLAMTAFASSQENQSLLDLPYSVQIFIQEFFGGLEVKKVEIEKNEYEVYLSNNTEIDFDKRGHWKKIKSKNGIPLEVLPNLSKEYILENYPNIKTIEIEKERGKYEVLLENNIELVFSKNGEISKREE